MLHMFSKYYYRNLWCSYLQITSLYLQNDMTLLMIAARDGNSDIVSALLEHGADVDKQDVSAYCIPRHACMDVDPRVCKIAD